MATIYNIKIKTVSPFISYSEEEVKEIMERLINSYRNITTGLKFESTEIEVEKQ